MADVTLRAPANPYRVEAAHDGMLATGWMGGLAEPSPPQYDTERGPGLTAGDLNRIAVDHHRAGYAKAQREAEEKIEAMRAQLAQAFDEGFTAGRVVRASGLASDVYARLIEPSVMLTSAMNAPKSRVAERLPAVKTALSDVTEFLLSLIGHEGESRAAAQIARDEG